MRQYERLLKMDNTQDNTQETAPERARRLWNSKPEIYTPTPVREWQVGGKVRNSFGHVHTILKIIRGVDHGSGERFIYDRIIFSGGYESSYHPTYRLDYRKD